MCLHFREFRNAPTVADRITARTVDTLDGQVVSFGVHRGLLSPATLKFVVSMVFHLTEVLTERRLISVAWLTSPLRFRTVHGLSETLATPEKLFFVLERHPEVHGKFLNLARELGH